MKTLSPNKRVSQQAIAEIAGVKRPVVSVVLSGQPTSIGVSAATRQRVLDAAQQLGYKPRFAPTNSWGRAKTRTIVWLGDTHPPLPQGDWLLHTSSMYFQRMLHSVVGTLDEHQFVLTIKPWRNPETMLDWLADSGAEGIIWRASQTDQRYLPAIAKQLPVVVVNQIVQANVDVVRINQDDNARIALEHLWEHGHRRIAYFGFSNNLIQQRANSYQKFMSEHGLPVCSEFLELPDDPTVDPTTKAITMLDTWAQLGNKRPTALITGDIFALPVLVEAHRRHINMPAELSIIGIDNYSAGAMSRPALTSMDQPLEELGRTAVEMLLRRIDAPDRPIQTTEIHPRLVVRDSVANMRKCRDIR